MLMRKKLTSSKFSLKNNSLEIFFFIFTLNKKLFFE